jgi:hypothetical protein
LQDDEDLVMAVEGWALILVGPGLQFVNCLTAFGKLCNQMQVSRNGVEPSIRIAAMLQAMLTGRR